MKSFNFFRGFFLIRNTARLTEENGSEIYFPPTTFQCTIVHITEPSKCITSPANKNEMPSEIWTRFSKIEEDNFCSSHNVGILVKKGRLGPLTSHGPLGKDLLSFFISLTISLSFRRPTKSKFEANGKVKPG